MPWKPEKWELEQEKKRSLTEFGSDDILFVSQEGKEPDPVQLLYGLSELNSKRGNKYFRQVREDFEKRKKWVPIKQQVHNILEQKNIIGIGVNSMCKHRYTTAMHVEFERFISYCLDCKEYITCGECVSDAPVCHYYYD